MMQFIHTPVHEHQCPRCGTPYKLTNVVDLNPKEFKLDADGEGTPELVHVTVVCGVCADESRLTFPLKSPPLEQILKEFHRADN